MPTEPIGLETGVVAHLRARRRYARDVLTEIVGNTGSSAAGFVWCLFLDDLLLRFFLGELECAPAL